MYELKLYSKKALKLIPFLAVAAIALFFFGSIGKALTYVLIMVIGELGLFAFIGYQIGRKERSGGRQNTVNLTKNRKLREQIVRSFIEKYGIALTDMQIKCMVDASYTSYPWELEIVSMSFDYNVVGEWYKGPTCWIRIYLQAFKSLDIVSDFEIQYRIVMDAFTQIVSESFENCSSIEQCIDLINRKYLVYFDEISFLAMYQYMKRLGYVADIPQKAFVKYESELDKLESKYQ